MNVKRTARRPSANCAYCGGRIWGEPVERVGELGSSNFYLETLHPDCAKTEDVNADYEEGFHPVNWGEWQRPDSPEAAADAAAQARQTEIDAGQLEMFPE